ncbi:beta-lactamase class A [Sphingomonas desiccabilis]|nr:serine hydrolase [Sphingomonas desiccabilis]MBB3912241.1 beta-lactamase class A [Sphingomonas desiccabilis]
MTSGQQFTATQRALILLGSAPFVLMGCAVHEVRQQPVSLLPPPGSATSSYRVAVPVPPPPPPLPQAPADLTRAITTLLANFNGTAAAAVTSIDQGWTVAYNGNRPMPQQSVSKLWVAMTALDLLDQGKLTLEDPVVVRREDLTLFHQPIASLVKGDGYQTTVRELMRRALTMSDNTANDRLLTYVGGPDAVRAFLTRRGIQNIRFGPGERLLQSKTAGVTWRQEYSLGGGFNQARSALPQSVRLAAFNAYVANPPDGAGATAIAEALMRLKQGKLLSPGSTRHMLDTMAASRTGRARLHAALPPGWTLAHKTGTGQDLMSRNAGFNDVGILTAPDGRSYAVAVLIGDTTAPMRQRQELIQQVVHALVANRR